MEKEYYIVEGDTRVGPLSISQLAEKGIAPSTLVWTAGMADWTRADNVADLAPLLANQVAAAENESAFGAYAQPQRPANPYQQPQQVVPNRPYQQPQQPMNPYQQPQQYGAYNNPSQGGGFSGSSTNWKTLAIIATVCGFLFSCIGGIVGIFAILQGNKIEEATRRGDFYAAESASSSCKTLTIVSFVITGIGLIVNIFYFATLFNSL